MSRTPAALACLVLAGASTLLLGCGTKNEAAPVDASVPETGVDAAVACTTDLMHDPKNCGICAHDCLGGVCYLGSCDPAVVAGNLDLPSAMVLDGKYLYFAYSGHVARVLAAGGAVEDLSTQAFTAQKLAVDATYVYVMTGSNVIRFPKAGDADGGASERLAPAVGRALAIDVSNILFQVPAGLASAPKAGTGGDGGASVLLAALGSDTINDLAVDDTFAFFSLPGPGTILKVPKAGSVGDAGAGVLASGEAAPTNVVVDATYVYFTNNSGGAVRRVPKAGGPATDFVTGLGRPRALAIDAARLYYTDELKGDVGSCPLSGCAAGMQTYAKGMNPVAVAADAVAVYFLDFSGRALLRVAR
jgi:hypothetical protein